MDMTIDPNSPVPLHAQAEAILRRMIARPPYSRGQMLPEETGLARRLGISRGTLRTAIGRLVQEKLLERRRGQGTRVVTDRLESRLNAWGSFTAEMQAKGVVVERLMTRAAMRDCERSAAIALGLEQGEPCLCLDRVSGCAGERLVHFRSWLHPRLGLDARDDFTDPLYQIIEQHCQVIARRSVEQITAEPAGSLIARRLRVDRDTALLVRRRRVLDIGGGPIEYAINHYRGDRFSYTAEMTRELDDG